MSTAATSRKASAGSPNARTASPGRRPGPNDRPATLPDHGGRTRPNWFTTFAQHTAHLAGRPITFLLAVITIVVWAVTGPLFGHSDTWQLVINTGTTIVTFLMVFLIQNSQNRNFLAFRSELTSFS